MHGPNRYHRNRLQFARRLHGDPSIEATDLLYMELYPFQSKRVTGPMAPPPDLLARYILNPIAELDVPFVFAFGKPWLAVATAIGLGQGRQLDIAWATPSRSARSYPLTRRQSLIVMTQHAYSGPPGRADTEALRVTLAY